ncbi:hypothetical protein G7067_09285 [Leucobacter insecticola]|uniref:Uncharacterized protein n=2 Tax=Leucobacter insecticola TaxID=2714934 RepID=A0A6G8FJP0_9MICO|nr:hypothetical protein G7067_09285 [Leucobacter insecticola]
MSVGINAFFQNDAANTLVSVVFPEGLTSLDIFEQAFYQYASNEDNTLRDIVFPSSLKSLNIRAGAFSQGRRVYSTGDNALASVTFPEGLETLAIGDHAFYQIGACFRVRITPCVRSTSRRR